MWGDSSKGGSGAPSGTGYHFSYGINDTNYVFIASETYEKTLNITITDNGPTDVALSNNTIAEGNVVGAVIGNLSTTGGTSPFTYSLIPGMGSEDNTKFQISGGELQLNFIPDYENPADENGDNVYVVRIETSEGDGPEMEEATTDGDDYSSAFNQHGGLYNADNYPNYNAFAAIKPDGSISAWGHGWTGGYAPSGTSFIKIYSAWNAFAALKTDGSITA